MLETLPSTERRWLSRNADLITVGPGGVILPAGTPARWVFGLTEGRAVAEWAPPGSTFEAGTWFPATAARGVLQTVPGTIRAVTVSCLVVLGIREFRGALDTLPHFRRQVAASGALGPRPTVEV